MSVHRRFDSILAEAVTKFEWTLVDRAKVRLQLPALPDAGMPEPPRIRLDFDAGGIDEMIDRLTALRSQMLPEPHRNQPRTFASFWSTDLP
jgi:hypothetical protein